jgi:hypothetical protein
LLNSGVCQKARRSFLVVRSHEGVHKPHGQVQRLTHMTGICLGVNRKAKTPVIVIGVAYCSSLEDFRFTAWVVLGSTLTCSAMPAWLSGKSMAK